MIRASYNRQLNPPAPMVLVKLSSTVSDASLSNVPAQIDTAADWTLIPTSMLEELELDAINSVEIGGVGGSIELMPTYAIRLAILGLTEQLIQVVGHAEEPWIILGRDVLNHHRMVLDGPNQTLEMS